MRSQADFAKGINSHFLKEEKLINKITRIIPKLLVIDDRFRVFFGCGI